MKMLLIKKLNKSIESNVLCKLLVLLVVKVEFEAVNEDAVVVLFKALLLEDDVVKVVLLQAFFLEALSQTSLAKLKLLKVKAGCCKDVLCKALCGEAPPRG